MTESQIEEQDREQEKKARFSFKAWKKIIGYLYSQRKLIALLIASTVLMVALDITFPLLQKHIIDNFIEMKTTEGLIYFAVAYFGCILLQTALIIVFFGFCIKLEMKILEILRNKIFNKFQVLPVSYFNNRSVGYLVAKTHSDTERIGSTVAWGIIDIIWPILYILGIFVVMLTQNWQIALIVMVIVPIALGMSIIFERKLLKRNREIRRINSAISGALNEGITGARTIKTLNIENKMTAEFEDQTSDMYRKTKKYNRILALYVSLLIFLGSFALAVSIAIGGGLANVNGMSIGTLSLFISFTTQLINPVMQLAESLTNLVANQANVERTLGIIEAEPKLFDTPEVIEKYGDNFNPKYENWEPLLGDIEFKNVSFKYDDDERYILKDFNLKIPRGSSLALVGETGAGKTTIVNLLCRFYEPTEGQILIDGRDYRERSQLWLSKHLGYVLQTPHLFSGTIKDNIKYARPDESDEKMEQAARLVSADKVVEKLENGYDSEIGECGDSLSTGEKQLLTFARAIFADPKIIILDEATSSIDTETESLIQNAITRILTDRTSIMIAHRLSTIKNADNILLIEDGAIQEQGAHSELMQKKGRYYNLYTKMYELESISKTFDDVSAE